MGLGLLLAETQPWLDSGARQMAGLGSLFWRGRRRAVKSQGVRGLTPGTLKGALHTYHLGWKKAPADEVT